MHICYDITYNSLACDITVWGNRTAVTNGTAFQKHDYGDLEFH